MDIVIALPPASRGVGPFVRGKLGLTSTWTSNLAFLQRFNIFSRFLLSRRPFVSYSYISLSFHSAVISNTFRRDQWARLSTSKVTVECCIGVLVFKPRSCSNRVPTFHHQIFNSFSVPICYSLAFSEINDAKYDVYI